MPIKRFIRNVIAFCLYYTGLLFLLSRVRFKDRAVVLMYHRVVAEKDRAKCFSQDGIVVSLHTFEEQMRFLSNHFKVISLDEFTSRIDGKTPFASGSCLLTFDDGWKDNFQNAHPLLKEIGIPAVIFLTADFVGTQDLFWQERVTESLVRLYNTAENDSNLAACFMREVPDPDISTLLRCKRRNLNEGIFKYVGQLKGKSKEEIEDVAHRLAVLAGQSDTGKTTEEAFMDWDEIRVMAKNRISFGSHGKSHAILTRMQPSEIEKEVRESKERIEEELGTSVSSFSYPNGDHSERVMEIVRNAGYKVAFSTKRGIHSATNNPFNIRRINIHGDMTDTIPMFLARIVGLW